MKEKKQLTAEEYRALAQQHRQQAASQMKVFLVTGVLVVAMAVALIVAGVAWFANNKEVNLVETGISAMGGPFELACTGQNQARHIVVTDTDDGLEETDTRKIYKSTAQQSGTDPYCYSITNGATGNKKLVTTAGKAAIRWWMDVEHSDFMDNQTGAAYRMLEPGTHGKLTFYVIANQELGVIDFTLKLTGYRLDNGGQIIIQNTNNGNDIHVSEIEDNETQGKIEHHILFFTNRTETDGPYPYSGWIRDGKFSVDMTGVQKGEAMEVTLYWVWPAYYDQFCYEDTDYVNLHQIQPICAEGGADYQALLDDMDDHPENYLSTFGNGFAYVERTDFEKARIMYNAADSDIGSLNHYLQVTITGE